MSSTRRTLLKGLTATAGAAALGTPSLVRSAQPDQRKLIVVCAQGGWDLAKVFVSPDALDTDDPEVGWSEGSAHGLSFVEHADRPAVSDFFERHGGRTSILQGMLVRSVNHRVCARLVLTGRSSAGAADWPSIIGAESAARYTLPSVVMSGFSSPGPLQRYSNIVGKSGQLQSLLNRNVYGMGDTPVFPPPESQLDKVDALLAQRVSDLLAATPADAASQRVLEVVDDSLWRIDALQARADELDFRSDDTLDAVMLSAVTLLEKGVSRCVTVGQPGFDHHASVDEQDFLLDLLFGSLTLLVDTLRATPGEHAPTLADETMIVVVSEMARTPWRNAKAGRDHWPYTSCMLIGSGVRGGQMVGAYNPSMEGQAIDLGSGAVRAGGTVVTPSNLGATLLTLMGIDRKVWLPDHEPIGALLS